MSRSSTRQFSADCFDAFVKMGFDNDSLLPKDTVLARAPGQDSNLEKCPQHLWHVIQTHGGHTTKGVTQGTRNRIVHQLRQWKTKTYRGGAGKITRRRPVEELTAQLERQVPTVTHLVARAQEIYSTSAEVTAARPRTEGVVVWGGNNSCTTYWKAERAWLISTFAALTSSKPSSSRVVLKERLTSSPRYKALQDAIEEANETFYNSQCGFFACQPNKCTCLSMVAWEARDIFVKMFLDSLTDSSSAKIKFFSPADDAKLPRGSEAALYNIAGFLVNKLKKKSGTQERVSAKQARAFAVFAVTNRTSQSAAMGSGMPFKKVARRQYTNDSLTYVSPPFYAFISRLELVFWLNLTPHNIATCGGNFVPDLVLFASQDVNVLRAWQTCCDCVMTQVLQTTPHGDRQQVTTEVKQGALLVFELLVATFANVRAKEFQSKFVQQSSVGPARMSGHRDLMAAQVSLSRKKTIPKQS